MLCLFCIVISKFHLSEEVFSVKSTSNCHRALFYRITLKTLRSGYFPVNSPNTFRTAISQKEAYLGLCQTSKMEFFEKEKNAKYALAEHLCNTASVFLLEC